MISHDERINAVLSELNSVSEHECNYFHERTLLIPSRKSVIKIIKRIQETPFKKQLRSKIILRKQLLLKRLLLLMILYYFLMNRK